MTKNVLASTVIAALLFGTSQAALADVIKLTDSATLQQQHGERYFSQSGISGEKVVPVETAGADMSLSLATQLIVPDSWLVKSEGDLDGALVSWSGGVSWPIILRNIANNEGVFINLDWVKKIAMIHVPGQTKSENAIASKQQNEFATERNEFRKKQKQEWELRNEQANKLKSESEQLGIFVQRQKDAQKETNKFIKDLNSQKSELENNITTLQAALEEEREKRVAVETKYAVIDPSLAEESAVDATELFGKFEGLWVKPFDDSFDYYIKGGHSDVIETHTPATYIAKSGSIEDVLIEWASQVGWHIEYKAGVQHHNPYEITLKGSFIDATRELISGFKTSDRPIDIQFFPDVVVRTADGEKRYGLARIIDRNYKKTR